MKEIQAVKNPLVKELRKLQQKKYRDQEGRYLLEGFHLVQEAQKSDAQLEMVLVDSRGAKQWLTWLLENEQLPQYLVSEEVMASLSDLPSPQGMIGVIKKSQQPPSVFSGRWLLLDTIQDPGNVGTMIRTADAAGFTGVVLGKGCADLYSHKVLRSMQGSNFHLPILQADLSQLIPQLKEQLTVYGTKLDPLAKAYQSVSPKENIALIMGNEGQGVSETLLALTDANLYIPIYGAAESLNVGVAAGILMYHFVS